MTSYNNQRISQLEKEVNDLKEEIANGLVIKADSSVASGFKVGVQNGAAFYDFSSEAVAELFGSYLNPVTAKILKEAASE